MKRWLRRPEVALFALALGAYAYFYQAGGWNQNSRFDLVRSTVEQRTARIDGYHRNTGDHARKDGHYYCDKAPGASWLGVPAYAVAYALAGSEHPSPRFLANASYAVTVWAVGVPAAAAVAALALLLGALGLGLRARLALAAAYAFGTLAFPYATLFYGHQLMAALLVIGFAVLVCARRRMVDGGPPPSPVALVGAGLALGFAVVVEYPAALAVGPIFAYGCWTLWRAARFRVGWLVLGGAIPALALAAYHAMVFGGPLTLPYDFSTQPHRGQGFMGIGAPRDGATWGILFSSYRGLFYSAPWLLLSLPGAVMLLLRGRSRAAPAETGVALGRAEACVCVVIALAFIALNVSLVDWQGGWAMGPRYLIPAIPFLVIAVGGLVLGWPDSWPRAAAIGGWTGLGAAVGYAAFCMLIGTAVKPEVPVYEKQPFARVLRPAFFAGDLAVSTQSIDSKGAPRSGPRAAWNLGHKLGLRGKATLLPLALFSAVGLAWLLWAARRSRPQPTRAPSPTRSAGPLALR